MKIYLFAMFFVTTVALIARATRAFAFGLFGSGFGDFAGGIVIIQNDRTIRIQRIKGYSYKDIILSDPKAKVTDARWSGDKLVVQLINGQGRREARIYKSFNSFSTK